MLVPAQLYKSQLRDKFLKTWGDMRYQWYDYDGSRSIPEIPDNTDEYTHWVSIDKHENVIGYFSYYYLRDVNRLERFGLISFDIGNPILLRDVERHIFQLLDECNLNGMQWHCYTDSPAIKIYRTVIKKYGGREVGPLHQTNRLADGKLHDYVIFEIMRSDMINFWHFRTRKRIPYHLEQGDSINTIAKMVCDNQPMIDDNYGYSKRVDFLNDV